MKFYCDHCNQKIEADRTLSGSIMVCPACAQAFRVPEYGLLPGDRLEGFILKKRLGAGGMGDVWLAEQESMQRECAVKILSPDLTVHQQFITRFMQEVKSSGKLQHQNIVTAYYAGEYDGMFYLAMECVSGENLDTILKEKGQLDEDTVLKVARATAEALDYAWTDFRLIHRDLKPSNIMIDDSNKVKILDFGIAKSLDGKDNAHLTQTGAILGTPYYMSPEQASKNGELDCRSDIYSLGAVLYHLLAGEPPFQGDTPVGILAQHLSGQTQPIRKVAPNVSQPTATMIEKMMNKTREKRYQNWRKVIEDIDRIRQNRRLVNYKMVIAAAAVILLIPLATALSVSYFKGDSSNSQIEELDGKLAKLDDDSPAATPIKISETDGNTAFISSAPKVETIKDDSTSNNLIQNNPFDPKLPEPKLDGNQKKQNGFTGQRPPDRPDNVMGFDGQNNPADMPPGTPPEYNNTGRHRPPLSKLVNTLQGALLSQGFNREQAAEIMGICVAGQKSIHDSLFEKMRGNLTDKQFKKKLKEIPQKVQAKMKEKLSTEEYKRFQKAYNVYLKALNKSISTESFRRPRRRPRWNDNRL